LAHENVLPDDPARTEAGWTGIRAMLADSLR